MKAVIWTDVLQATVMFIGLFAVITQGSVMTLHFLEESLLHK